MTIDEICYLLFDCNEANLLLNLIARRYEHGSMCWPANITDSRYSVEKFYFLACLFSLIDLM
ncbi:ATP-binding protein [Pseudomonas sessilinigenes]|uniref:ATP-binding protein n=1 Tax=Pseudomonas sessilinigenes TaxID=658629 RepID=A0ABX8MJR1_9PSED|nr:ATP-binding protein [Pseudomonas sessilinigenes]